MSNPVFSDSTAEAFALNGGVVSADRMTISGTINKTFIMFALLVLAFGVVFYQYLLGYTDKVMLLTTVGAVVGLVLALIITFVRKAMNILVPIYAFVEGAVLGGVSAIFEASHPGVVTQAVAMTFLTVFSMLFLYKANVIKATEKFRSTILIATLAIVVFYLITFVLSFFNIAVPIVHSSSLIGIGFSILVVGIAALNLILDFDFQVH